MDNMNNTYATYEVMLTAGFDNYEIQSITTNLNDRNRWVPVGWWFGIGYGADTTTEGSDYIFFNQRYNDNADTASNSVNARWFQWPANADSA